jgi:branched-chain amino acid transport system substrate-binding protein
MRKQFLTVVAVALCTAVASFAAKAADDDLLIGTLFPLTGPGAATGAEQEHGVDLAIEHLNAAGGIGGHKLRAVVEDSIGRPDQAVLGYNRLVGLNKVPVVMSAYSSVSLAIAPLGARDKVLVVNSGPQADQLGDAGPFLLNTIPQVHGEAKVLAQYAWQKLGKTAALLYENAAAGQSGSRDFKTAFEALGGKIVADQPTEFGQTNYRPALLTIKAANPAMVYVAVTQNFDTIAEQVSQTPHFPPVIGNTYSTPFFGKAGAVGFYNTTVLSNSPPALAAEFKKKFNTDFFEINAREYYNAVYIIGQGMKKALDDGKPVTGETLRDAILQIGTFNSDIANISFNADSHGPGQSSYTAQRPIIIQQNQEHDRLTIPFTPE